MRFFSGWKFGWIISAGRRNSVRVGSFGRCCFQFISENFPPSNILLLFVCHYFICSDPTLATHQHHYHYHHHFEVKSILYLSEREKEQQQKKIQMFLRVLISIVDCWWPVSPVCLCVKGHVNRAIDNIHHQQQQPKRAQYFKWMKILLEKYWLDSPFFFMNNKRRNLFFSIFFPRPEWCGG